MIDQRNPFRPAFGNAPRVWAGRSDILAAYATSLNSFPGDQARTIVVSGLRGIGKTTLLNELEDISRQQGWLTLRVHVTDADPIATLVNTTIPALIEELSPPTKRTITGATITGIGAIQTTLHENPPPQPTLNSQLRKLAALLQPHGTGIVISVDEVQHASTETLGMIATACQDLIRDDLDISLIVAGLSYGVDKLLQSPGTTFLRRGLRVELEPLSHAESYEALLSTAEDSVVSMAKDAADNAATFAQGHPYLVQLIGSLSWAHAKQNDAPQIRVADVEAMKTSAVTTLGLQVHQPELKYLSQAETRFVEAMAVAMENAHHAEVARVAEVLGKPVTSISDTRARLLVKEVIAVPARGVVSFQLPYLKEYLLMPDSKYPYKDLSY